MAKEKVEKSQTDMLLDRAVGEIQKKWGKTSLIVPGQEIDITKDTLTTGISPLDGILGNGGLAKGSIVELFGWEGSGKSTICLQIIAQAQKTGLKTLFIDQEHALDPTYAGAVGVNIDDLYIAQPTSMEEALGIVETLVSTGEVGLVVVDSIASLVPQAELDKPFDEMTMGLQPKLMSTWLRRFNPIIAGTDTILIFTNQLRDKLSYGGGSLTPGGRAVKFYASYRIEVKVIEKIKGPDGYEIGNKLRLTAVKNKKFSPYRQVEVRLLFGEGIDIMESVIMDAVQFELFLKSGAWYTFNPAYFTMPEGEEKYCGKEATKEYLLEHPEALALMETYIADFKGVPNA